MFTGGQWFDGKSLACRIVGVIERLISAPANLIKKPRKYRGFFILNSPGSSDRLFYALGSET